VDDLLLSTGTESRALRESLVDGVVVLGNLQPEVDQRLTGAVGTRLVRAEANVWEPVGCIRRDEDAAGRLVAEHLLRTNRRPLCWIGNSEPWRIGHFSATERRAGFLAAAATAGEPVREILLARQLTDDQQRDVRESLKPNVGYACSDSVLVRQLNDIAAPLGCLPGRDFGVACCDDAQMVMQYLPRLARVRFDRFGLGRQAAGMLVERIEDPDAPCASRKVVGDFFAGSTL
jgi:DNA-binding LacI/PurR family transcriptional regulator